MRLTDWLLDSDPALRWQVLRDLLDAPADVVADERARVAGDPPDERAGEAIELVRSKQQRDGTWLLEHTYPGEVWFELEDGDGRPSRWNTLRAMRVLRWHDEGGRSVADM